MNDEFHEDTSQTHSLRHAAWKYVDNNIIDARRRSCWRRL